MRFNLYLMFAAVLCGLVFGAAWKFLNSNPTTKDQLASFIASNSPLAPNSSARNLENFPPVVLWAWARNEDLTFINPREAGVAFLAETIALRGSDLSFIPRRQSLRLAPSTKLMAVIRIEEENPRGSETVSDTSEAQCQRIADEIADIAHRQNIAAVQIDFDATTSQREFYRAILNETRRRLPLEMPLSITALASWCLDDKWIEDLPIDEAVPMLFRMGADRRGILARLKAGENFRASKCRGRAGISTDEADVSFPASERIFIFHPRAWTNEAATSAIAAARDAKEKSYAN